MSLSFVLFLFFLNFSISVVGRFGYCFSPAGKNVHAVWMATSLKECLYEREASLSLLMALRDRIYDAYTAATFASELARLASWLNWLLTLWDSLQLGTKFSSI
jgi:hypothetical protein